MEWPAKLLTQNRELRKDNIWNWSLPAHVVTLSDGQRFNVCPNAGSCGRVCYAKFGTYQFRNVKARHLLNLEAVLNHPNEWLEMMSLELDHKRFRPTGVPRLVVGLPMWGTGDDWLDLWVHSGGAAVRIHDGGDFFSKDYLGMWLHLAATHPNTLFYAYTKEVQMLKETTALPQNFRHIFSTGGRQDHLIDFDVDRHADVFPHLQTLEARGYMDQSANDLLAVLLPTNRIGIVANNIPVARKRFAGRAMSEMTA
jgi:hypothetical protein